MLRISWICAVLASILAINYCPVLASTEFTDHQWILFPGGDGQRHVALLTGASVPSFNDSLVTPHTRQKVNFYLYSRKNPFKATQLTKEDLNGASFDSQKSLKILIHGYAASSSSAWLTRMKSEMLIAEDCQVLVVDWSLLSSPPLYNYAAMRHAEFTGWLLAELLSYLSEFKAIQFSQLHLIGHDLGAHLAAFTSRYVTDMTGEKVMRITALDPALPLFEDPNGKRLKESDAKFVDVIHTSSGWLGIDEPIGHADFYPNGGICAQPGCVEDYSGCCSHMRAVEYFIESISSSDFRALPCQNYSDFINSACSYRGAISMGYNTSLLAQGKFFLATSTTTPFALG